LTIPVPIIPIMCWWDVKPYSINQALTIVGVTVCVNLQLAFSDVIGMLVLVGVEYCNFCALSDALKIKCKPIYSY